MNVGVKPDWQASSALSSVWEVQGTWLLATVAGYSPHGGCMETVPGCVAGTVLCRGFLLLEVVHASLYIVMQFPGSGVP